LDCGIEGLIDWIGKLTDPIVQCSQYSNSITRLRHYQIHISTNVDASMKAVAGRENRLL